MHIHKINFNENDNRLVVEKKKLRWVEKAYNNSRSWCD